VENQTQLVALVVVVIFQLAPVLEHQDKVLRVELEEQALAVLALVTHTAWAVEAVLALLVVMDMLVVVAVVVRA
jgi:hypothetical protein